MSALRLALLLPLASVLVLAGAPPRLGVQGHRFTVDGTPRFLVLVSYFDALRASDATLETDFSFFRAHGVDGVRVFATWWDCTGRNGCGGRPSPTTLLDASGNVRPAVMTRLRQLLERAAAHRLIVDLTFARETVQDGDRALGGADYVRGMEAVIRALRGTAPHVLIDLQNEVEINRLGLGSDPIADVAAAATQLDGVDPNRLLIASVSGGSHEAVRLAAATRTPPVLDAIAWHDPRGPNWGTRAADGVHSIRRTDPRPVYLQEPTAFQREGARPDDSAQPSEFTGARRAAEQAGAAAWLFHTRYGFRLAERSFVAQLEPGAREVFAQLARERKRAPSP